MDKKCTACGKTVYPLEQLKCLDQIWHKQCFKCEVCGMTLNMKNYKGLEKKPYCSAHYPQPKAYTFVSDNPEMQRVKQNTAVISNVKYHEEFEKSKGTRMAVTEDMMTPSAGAAARKPAPPPVAATAQSSNAAVAPVNSSYTGQSTVYTTSAIGRRQQPHQPAAPEPHQPRLLTAITRPATAATPTTAAYPGIAAMVSPLPLSLCHRQPQFSSTSRRQHRFSSTSRRQPRFSSTSQRSLRRRQLQLRRLRLRPPPLKLLIAGAASGLCMTTQPRTMTK
ncbi:hypothetical protein BOX15_Mlig000878g1 [Macrostomum lignano]|uniref:LIM zinc-binding domain-containing protein n=1 Tax=Macrostomum lignano TaxID=282301 RepID=A0A267FVP9_9PLAT|nr:hypothetical protein BOX15_Mlig000878g1 [Macrostomum lignano]